MYALLVTSLLFFANIIDAQFSTKNIVHFCNATDPNSCGEEGICIKKETGNRCKCPVGFMGIKCKRPCQDIYKSCEIWEQEKRCQWAKSTTMFFDDNCALSCGVCQSNGVVLEKPLPPVMEPIAWMVGRWETRTIAGKRFPMSLAAPYKEVLDITVTTVPKFDRPSLSVSVYAQTVDGGDERSELGYITCKPFNEDTGFIEWDKPNNGSDRIAIELTGNAGLTTVEEGEISENEATVEVAYYVMIDDNITSIRTAKRKFALLSADTLVERAFIENDDGVVYKWKKRYKKMRDYLSGN